MGRYAPCAASADHAREGVSHYLYSSLYPGERLSAGGALNVYENSIRKSGYRWSGKYTSKSVWAAFSPATQGFRLSWSGYAEDYSTIDGTTDYSGFYSDVAVTFKNIELLDQSIPLALAVQYSETFARI